MPELPEVETICNDLRSKIVSKTIVAVIVNHEKPLRHVAKTDFIKSQLGKKVLEVNRRGKQILIVLAGGLSLIIHLKMSGSLVLCEDEPDALRHVHCIWQFDDGTRLFFRDPRRFGYVILVETALADSSRELVGLGLEPLPKMPQEYLMAAMSRTGRPIKAVLLDQSVIAGIGNIYADEICHEAGINPMAPARSLSAAQARAICLAVEKVLIAAIEARGTTISDYRDGSGDRGKFGVRLKVYGREKCKDCQTKLKVTKIAGRTTRYCPRCQK